MSTVPKEPKILLVEDAAVMRKIELKALKSLGFEDILEAKDGDEAILKLESEEAIDLVISDWNMPNKGGYELLVWMRAHEKFEKLPFIMATGEGDMKQEKKAVDAGVSGFIAKPFNADELKKKIDQAFGRGAEEDRIRKGEVEDCSYSDHGSSGFGRLETPYQQWGSGPQAL